MNQQVIKIPINNFASLESVIAKINQSVEGKNLGGIFVNRLSLMKSEVEILLDEPQNVIKVERPSKIKQGTSSFYCVYQRGNKWTYKFVRKNVAYNGKLFDDEMDAVLAYDAHVYSVDGHTAKLNFPEHYTEVNK